MSFRENVRSLAWLAVVAAAAVGGWFYGRGFVASDVPPAQVRAGSSGPRSEPVFAADSPRGVWMAGVKNAAPTDFPKLLEQWEALFPLGEGDLEGRPEHALRWLLGMWVVKDPEGFLRVVTAPSYREDPDGFLRPVTTPFFEYPTQAAQVLVQFMPAKAAELLFGPERAKLDRFFARDAVQELAARQPELYLKMDPDGTIDVTPGFGSADGDWFTAVANLAKTDPVAAGNACLRWKRENDPNSLSRALKAVAAAWKTGEASLAEWVNGIEDPKLRNYAQHARLAALAEQDPRAALAELDAVRLEETDGLDAPREILKQLAKADLVVALKLVKEVEGFVAKFDWHDFAETSAEDEVKMKGNPFSRLNPRGYSGEDEVENNGVRHAVLYAAVKNLPDDPTRFFGALQQLRADMGDGDSAWQRGVEGALLRLKCDDWSADACLTAAGLWVAESDGKQADPTLSELAARAARADPEQALAALGQLPEAARPAFAGEIIKRLPAANAAQRIALFGQLNAAQWDSELGTSLGGSPADYAPVIAALPAATTLGARQAFMEQWGEQDPEAAAQWLASLPNDAAAQPAAAGLATAWADYDKDAVSAWATTLPAGPVRDGAAASLAGSFAVRQPDEAWQWASSIADPPTRAEALTSVGYRWRSKAPEAFRVEMAKARAAVGLEDRDFMFIPPHSPPNDPFAE